MLHWALVLTNSLNRADEEHHSVDEALVGRRHQLICSCYRGFSPKSRSGDKSEIATQYNVAGSRCRGLKLVGIDNSLRCAEDDGGKSPVMAQIVPYRKQPLAHIVGK